MMMKLKLMITAFLFIARIGLSQDRFEIAGKLANVASGKMVMLTYQNSEGKSAKDSALVTNGKFSVKGTTAYGNKAYLALMPAKADTGKRTQPDYQEFYLSKGKYSVLGKDSISNASITGTKVQQDYMEYNALTSELLAKFKEISARFAKVYYAKVKDTLLIQSIQAEAKPVYAKIEKALDSFIFSHPDSYVSLDLILDNKTAVIDPITFDPYYKALSPEVLASFNGQKLTKKYDKARQLAIGKTVDFTQTDASGDEFKLSTLRGKYVLVDFWASWCAPCRAENPNLLKAYQKLKDKDFEIVGVSLDETKAAWLNAVKKDGMPWIQVSDLKGFKSDLAVLYGISAIPQNFLINPKGEIIAKNLRGEDVSAKLEELVK